MVRQRNSRVEPWGVCLQERQGKTEAFNSKQNTKGTFHTCLCVYDLTAVDGLRNLLQNGEQCDGGQPKAIRALHPKTKTHTGIFYIFVYLWMKRHNSTHVPPTHPILFTVPSQGMRTSRTEHCRKMSYNSGAPTLLAVRTNWSNTWSNSLHDAKAAHFLHRTTNRCLPAIISYIKDNQIIWLLVMFKYHSLSDF